MNSATWRTVLESIGPDDQPKIVVRTMDGFEIAVEQWASLEDEVALIKGRIAGAADGRRLFFIPYDKLSLIYVNRPVQQEEITKFSPQHKRASSHSPASAPSEVSEEAKEKELVPA